MTRRNPLDERWSLNTIRWLETGPYSHVPAVRRLADELQEGPQSPAGYRALKKKIETVFEVLEARGKLEPEDEAAAITKALLEGSLGIAESGVARPMPGTRQGPLRDIEERHPQAGQHQRQRERDAAVQQFPREAIDRINQLRTETTEEAGHRGHIMSWDDIVAAARGVSQAGTCTRCRRVIQLQSDPASWPRVGGRTLALDCTGATVRHHTPVEPSEDSLVKEWNLGYDLDGGGYSFERVRGTPLGSAIELLLHEEGLPLGTAQNIVEGLLMWDSPDLDYIIGSDDLPRHQADLLLIAPGYNHDNMSWPDKIPEPDAEGNLGNLMFEKRAGGELYETDHQCSWCEGAGHVRPEGAERSDCTRCDGDGYVNSPGGAWAIYERVEIENEDRPHDSGYDAASRDLERRPLSFVEEELERLRQQEHPLGRSATAGGWLDPAFVRGYADRLAQVAERRADIDENEDELLHIDLDSDEIDVLQGWYSGQGDPLYALQSSGTLERGRISGATSNLADILHRAEQGEADLEEDDAATIEGLIRKLEAAARH